MAEAAVRPQGDTLAQIEAALSPLQGRRILDIGCGGGRLLRALSKRGAVVAGVDPEASAVAAARMAAPEAELHVAGAEALPFADGTFDAAIFLNSLHHVPVALMRRALAEAGRVVGRGGSVIVVEPLPEGSFFEVLRPIEDETGIRLAAQEAVAAALRDGVLTEMGLCEYDRAEAFPDLAAFIDMAVQVEPARQDAARAARADIAALFGRLAETGPRGHVLHQPLRFQHLQGPR